MNPTEARNSELIRHLYVHFPFCARVCPYCAFYKTRGNAAEVGRFCEALVREMEQQETAALVPSTIYFGGGTPTALKTSQLEVILSAFHQRLDLSELKEWTIEANPSSVSARKATLLKKFGLNRVSLGVQSWDNDLLNLLGRENAVQAEESFAFPRRQFSNVSIDLMFALGQTERQWRDSLQKTITLKPEHISTYCLTYEEVTDFRAIRAQRIFRDEEKEAGFLSGDDDAGAGGLRTLRNLKLRASGFRSQHNQACWRGADYLAGPSAFPHGVSGAGRASPIITNTRSACLPTNRRSRS